MTKISKKSAYPIKNPIVGDYFVGTDSESNGKTVNFGFEYAVDLINRINGTLLINYKFVTDSNIDLAVLTDGVFVSTANQTVIDSVVQLKFNKRNLQEDDLNELFLFIKSNPLDFNIKLQNSANLVNAVYFSIISVISYSEYFIFNISIRKSNPSLTSLINSNIYFFNFEINSQGSVGTVGPQGAQGIQGVQGLKGDTGLQGIQGIQGVKGNDGAQGLKGDNGTQGVAGIQGIQGITGSTGSQGAKGDKGDIGTTGAAGSQGLKGDTGIQGLKGDTGLAGQQGIQGVKGDAGNNGLSAYQIAVNNGAFVGTEADFAAMLVNSTSKSPYSTFKFIQKGFGNTDLTINQVGDIFCGWKNDGAIRYSEAKWLGGVLTDSNNFIPLVQTEI